MKRKEIKREEREGAELVISQKTELIRFLMVFVSNKIKKEYQRILPSVDVYFEKGGTVPNILHYLKDTVKNC